MMSQVCPTTEELTKKVCKPCEGGVPAFTSDEISKYLPSVPGWLLTSDGTKIHRAWVLSNFVAGIEFFQQVCALAEADGHHPDLHLTGYRNVVIEIYTHAVGGLTENDFILAAKINAIPLDGQ